MRSNRSMPRSTVIPVLGYRDLEEAIRWLRDAFGFTLRLQIGDHRAQLNVGRGAIAITQLPADESPKGPNRPRGNDSVMVRIDDVDRHHARAKQRGARILQPPEDYPYGERQYTVEDLGGHVWTFSESIADVDPKTWGGTPGEL